MGYKGVDTTEALFDDVELPADSVLGGQRPAAASPR